MNIFKIHCSGNTVIYENCLDLYGTQQLEHNIWNAIVVDTFDPSHYMVNAAKPGSVATDAETEKCQKYKDLLDNYYF